MAKREDRESARHQREAELSAYTARWLQLADAALSATDKAARALELAREEQERTDRDEHQDGARLLVAEEGLAQRRDGGVRQAAVGVVGAILNVPQAAVDLAPQLLDLTINLPHSRQDETEADRVGVELAARAGYNPRAALALWEKMQKVGGAQPPKLLSTHPPTADRIKDLATVVEKVEPLYQAVKSGANASAGK